MKAIYIVTVKNRNTGSEDCYAFDDSETATKFEISVNEIADRRSLESICTESFSTLLDCKLSDEEINDLAESVVFMVEDGE